MDQFYKPKKKATAVSTLKPCEVLPPADAIRLVATLPNTTPHETILNPNQSGICAYAPLSTDNVAAGIDAQIYHRPAGTPVSQDYAMIAALCTDPLPGIGDRAGIGTRGNGLLGCVLTGTTIVTIAAIGTTRDAMVAELKAIAGRL